jgi:predicted phosphodiesterase/transposase-like protein
MNGKELICPGCYAKGLYKHGFDRGYQRWECKSCGKRSIYPIEDLDVVKANSRLAKQKQNLQDLNRIERKSFREHARVENAISEYTQELIKIFEKNRLNKLVKKHKSSNKAVGVIQFSDVHFNELVELQSNKYDFSIASKRCKDFVTKAIKYFTTAKVKNVVVALTGDLLNSDRRLDELLAMATNRSKATFLAVDILQQVILHLNHHFNLTVLSVSGNESRVKKDWGWGDLMATDSYDYTIFKMLEYLFKSSAIKFIEGDPLEIVVQVAGQNLLCLHGNGSVKKSGMESSVQQIIGRYGLKGIDIDYVIFGHIHSARVGDNFSRSSSMVGSNDYAEKALNLLGRASQNCYIFYDNGNRDGIKIDLQNPVSDGYNIDESLASYNAKSAAKVNRGETVFKVVI